MKHWLDIKKNIVIIICWSINVLVYYIHEYILVIFIYKLVGVCGMSMCQMQSSIPGVTRERCLLRLWETQYSDQIFSDIKSVCGSWEPAVAEIVKFSKKNTESIVELINLTIKYFSIKYFRFSNNNHFYTSYWNERRFRCNYIRIWSNSLTTKMYQMLEICVSYNIIYMGCWHSDFKLKLRLDYFDKIINND